ncbi:MAG: hypothetical protein U9R01_04860 [candidate division WOR-3 bacterium]|nr:hypothetical protein [candidate division WOR-3 bacterium]
MSKFLKKLCLMAIALILVLLTATMAFGGNIHPPIDPRPPTVYGIGGSGR